MRSHLSSSAALVRRQPSMAPGVGQCPPNLRYTALMSVRLGSKDVRVIDCHCHLGPVEWNTPSAPQTMFDVDGVRRRQDKAGVDISVFGNNWIRTPEWVSALEVMRRYNDFAAEITARYPDRFLG